MTRRRTERFSSSRPERTIRPLLMSVSVPVTVTGTSLKTRSRVSVGSCVIRPAQRQTARKRDSSFQPQLCRQARRKRAGACRRA